MQGQEDRFTGMSDEQITAALAQERKTATDNIPVEALRQARPSPRRAADQLPVHDRH